VVLAALTANTSAFWDALHATEKAKQAEGGNIILRNIRKFLPAYTASNLGRYSCYSVQ
jgi:hypothetical protein